jgi:hypothetical protein
LDGRGGVALFVAAAVFFFEILTFRRAATPIHCRGGKGRTSTFLALLDLLKNAAPLPLEIILERQTRLGDYDLRKPAAPASAKAPFRAERRAFVERFYDYAKENPGGAPPSWTSWLGAPKST